MNNKYFLHARAHPMRLCLTSIFLEVITAAGCIWHCFCRFSLLSCNCSAKPYSCCCFCLSFKSVTSLEMFCMPGLMRSAVSNASMASTYMLSCMHAKHARPTRVSQLYASKAFPGCAQFCLKRVAGLRVHAQLHACRTCQANMGFSVACKQGIPRLCAALF